MSASVAHRPELFPERMDGMVALDLGGYDGAAAHSCLERGAVRAVCVDNEQWRLYGWNGPNRRANVEYVESDILDWHEPGDFIILADCLYHNRHPWQLMEHVRTLTKPGGTLLLHTWVIDGEQDYWRIYLPKEAHPVSPTVAWLPMVPALGKLLTNVGFEDVTVKSRGGDRVTMLCR